MDKQSIIVYFVSLLIITSKALKIKNILVPDIELLDENKSVILDCDFDADEADTSLVVKWFHDDNLIYQWIIDHEPQAVGQFKEKLDLSYKPTNKKIGMHRALKIKQLSLDLAGEYKCVVFNYEEEDVKSKHMIVIDGPEKLELIQMEGIDDTISISCSAIEVYPEPIINITYTGNGGSNLFEEVENSSVQDDDNELFNVTQIVTLKTDQLSDESDFVCELTFPDTNFTIERKLEFIPDDATTMSPSWIILLTLLTTLMSTLLST